MPYIQSGMNYSLALLFLVIHKELVKTHYKCVTGVPISFWRGHSFTFCLQSLSVMLMLAFFSSISLSVLC